MRTLRIALASALLSVGAMNASAQQPQATDGTVNVAVFPLTGYVTGQDGRQLADAFRSMVISELGSGARLRLVEREAVDKLLEAQKISLSGTVSDAQAIRIGELLGAQYAVTGSISVIGKDARLDLRLVDIETGEIVPPPFKETVSSDKLLTLVNRVAEDFAGKAQVKARPVAVRIPPQAALTYARGLDFEKRGKKQDAAQMYRKTLEIFPQHPHARAALQRVN